MSNLFDKLATLVNAQINDALGKNPQSPLARIRLSPEAAEKDPRRSAASLRRRLEEAIEYEDVLQTKADALLQEAIDIDRQIDQLVRGGHEMEARRLQGQLNFKQQQLTIAESEVRDHRLLTRHLMQELNSLDAALERQERQGAEATPSTRATRQRTRIPLEGAQLPQRASERNIVDAVTNKLNETRDSLEGLINRPAAPAPSKTPRRFEKFDIVDEAPDPRQPKARKNDAVEMNRRLSRLRKPGADVE